MLGYNLLEFCRDFVERLVPGDALEPIADSLQGEFQPLRFILEVSNVGAFAADISTGTWIVFIRSHPKDLASLRHHLQPAIRSATAHRTFFSIRS